MGNDLGKNSTRMAIAAMANVTNFEKKELTALQKKFKSLAEREVSGLSVMRCHSSRTAAPSTRCSHVAMWMQMR